MKEGRKNILIVDDLTKNVKNLSGILEGFGYEVNVGKDFLETQKGIDKYSPELILVGDIVAGNNSFDCIRKLKNSDGSKGTPIMMYTSEDDSSKKIEAFNSGAVDYFSKPFLREELLARVKMHLSVGGIQKNLLWTKTILERTNKMSRVGGWEFNVATNDLYWSSITKSIHEVEDNYKPSIENAIIFYKEGKSREVMLRCIQEALQNGRNWDVELQLVTFKGKVIWVRSNGEPVFENGKVIRLFGTFQEISAEKQYKLELEKSESSMKEAQKIAKTGSWEKDLCTGELLWSDELYYLLGLNNSQVTSRELFMSKVHQDDLELFKRFDTRVFDQMREEIFEFRIVTTCGELKYVRAESRIVKDDKGVAVQIVGTAIDITKQKRVDEELEELQRDFRLSFETASIAICRLNAFGQFNLVNDKAVSLLGYSREELIGKSFSNVSHPDDKDKTIDSFQNVLEGGSDKLRLANRFVRKNGEIVWGEVSGTIVRGELDEDPFFFAYIFDMTMQKKSEETLNQYKNIVSSSEDILALVDKNYNYLIANESYLEAFNLSADELIGTSVIDVIGEEMFNITVKERADKCLGGEMVNFEGWLDFPKNGKRFMEVKYAPHFNSDNEIEGFVIDGRDITERKKSQERLKSLSTIQHIFMNDLSVKKSFEKMLEVLLENTGSEYGFIGEVLQREGEPYLKTQAIANIAWDDDTSEYCMKHTSSEMEFTNLDSLFGEVITNRESMIANDTESHSSKGEFLNGLPLMNNFIGLPFFHNNNLMGMVGMANKPGGYSKDDIELLDPFLATCSTLIKSFQDSIKKDDAEKERNKLADIVSYSNDAIISTDLSLRVISWNSGAQSLLGYSLEEMIGESVIPLCPHKFKQKHTALVRSVQGGSLVQSYETTQLRKDGVEVHVNMSLFPLIGDDGEVKGVSSILRDITSQKEAVEMKEKFTRNLEIKVSERTAELQRAKADLAQSLEKEKELGELKSRFVATASHQFRTPLTVIQSNMGVLAMQKNEMAEKVRPSFDKVYDRIKKQIGRMTSLMDDVLILGKINAGKITAKSNPIDLIELCKEVLSNYSEIQEDGRIVLFEQYGEPTLVELDSKQLEHVISNLLSNALKYSFEEKSPVLKVNYSKSDVVITVKDEGMGIPKKDLKNLFEPFYRASNVGDISGTGLGSTIAKEYVELNGGTISVNSRVGEGTEFIIEFKI